MDKMKALTLKIRKNPAVFCAMRGMAGTRVFVTFKSDADVTMQDYSVKSYAEFKTLCANLGIASE